MIDPITFFILTLVTREGRELLLDLLRAGLLMGTFALAYATAYSKDAVTNMKAAFYATLITIITWLILPYIMVCVADMLGISPSTPLLHP